MQRVAQGRTNIYVGLEHAPEESVLTANQIGSGGAKAVLAHGSL